MQMQALTSVYVSAQQFRFPGSLGFLDLRSTYIKTIRLGAKVGRSSCTRVRVSLPEREIDSLFTWANKSGLDQPGISTFTSPTYISYSHVTQKSSKSIYDPFITTGSSLLV